MTKEMNAGLQMLVKQTSNSSIMKMQQRLHDEVVALGKIALDQKESLEALTLALETERDAANLYAKQVAHWIGKHDAIKAQYEDLIYQVSRKFPGETRHETAKRYICNWEGRDADSVAKQEVKG